MLPLPSRTDVVTLPTLRKDADGGYAPRTLGGPLEQVLDVRGRILEAALGSFAPDLLVVDKVAAGASAASCCRRWARCTSRAAPAWCSACGRSWTGRRRRWPSGSARRRPRCSSTTTTGVGLRRPGGPRPRGRVRTAGRGAAMVVYTGYLGHGRGEGLVTRSRPAERVRVTADPYVLCTVGGYAFRPGAPAS